MNPSVVRFAARLGSLVLAFVLGVGLLALAFHLNWLSPFGIKHESQDSQVIRSVERIQEIALVSLGIEGIVDERKERTVFGVSVPGSGDATYIRYKFNAKLGIDGAKVQVTKTGEKSFRISVPQFEFIGYDNFESKIAVQDGGLLKFLTGDIDETAMINKILNDEGQAEYVDLNKEILKDQAEFFYTGLLRGIDPEISLDFQFE